MQQKQDKKPTPGKVIGVIIALMVFAPELAGVLIVIGLMILPFYILFRVGKNAKSEGAFPKKSNEAFDECPKPICFHRDKGEHHVRRGREIDPWDRPDIDISKYQRR